MYKLFKGLQQVMLIET